MIDCTIVIPHKDQNDDLALCLTNLRDQKTTLVYEVIVVHAPPIKKYHHTSPRHRHLYTEVSNPYVSRNIGIKASRGKYIAFLDAKCRPAPEWLQHLYDAIQAPGVSVVAGRYEVYAVTGDLQDAVYSLMYLNNEKNVRRGYGVTAGNMMTSRAAFDDLGLFEEDIVTGKDILWTKAALAAGHEIVYASGAVVSYPGQTLDHLRRSSLKYVQGIYDQSSSRLQDWLKLCMPWRLSTFQEALQYRGMQDVSMSKKIRLYLSIWTVKYGMSISFLKRWMGWRS